MTSITTYTYPLGSGIRPTPEFAKKKLADYAVNVGLKCAHDCTYCSTGAMLRTHKAFKELKKSSFASGYSIIDPDIPEKVAEDARRKHCEPVAFKRHLEEFCDLLGKDYPGVQIVLETNTWVDPKHHAVDPEASVKLNERMDSVWAVVRRVAMERNYPLVEIYERKKKETEAGTWDQRIRNQRLSQDKFGKRILDGSMDEEMKDVPGWFVDNHPNANGVRIIADEEFKTITRLWPKGLPTAQ